MRQTSCLFCLDAAALLMVNEQQTVLLVWSNQTSQAGYLSHSNTSPCSDCSLIILTINPLSKAHSDKMQESADSSVDYCIDAKIGNFRSLWKRESTAVNTGRPLHLV